MSTQAKTTRTNKEIVRLVIEELGNKHNTAMAPELIAEKLTSHALYDAYNPLTDKQVGYDAEVTLEDGEKVDAYFREQFPEQHTTIDEMFEMGDKVVTIATTTSTHKSGKKITTKAISVDRIADGKIVESWYSWDRLGEWQQLGMVPKTKELIAKLEAL